MHDLWYFIKSALVLSLLFMTNNTFASEDIPLRNDLNEQVVMIPVGKTFYGGAIKLETTIFKPNGLGPFPLLVVNDGKKIGNPVYQNRARYTVLVEEFLKRGYAVALPMQRGYSKSDGVFYENNCRIYDTAVTQGHDVRTVIEYLQELKYIDREKIIVAGQSYGALSTLALADGNAKGVKLLLNFAGGIYDTSCDWETALSTAMLKLGKKSKIPSLWFYGENDSVFGEQLIKKIFLNFTSEKTNAELIFFPKFREDSHVMFGTLDGFNNIWWPVVEKKLIELNMPTAAVENNYGLPYLEGSGYANVNDLDKLPEFSIAACKELYINFIKKSKPRAFAFSEDGHCGLANDYDDPRFWAMNICKRYSKKKCALYLVDDNVVWQVN